MRKWERIAHDWLSNRETEVFLTSADLRGIYSEARKMCDVGTEAAGRASFDRWKANLQDTGIVAKVRRGMYANLAHPARPSPERGAAILRPGAIVSLQTVLGSVGVINNPSRTTFSILSGSDAASTSKRQISTPFGDYAFSTMKDEIILAGDEGDRLDASFDYPRATPERALCDWLYLSSSRGASDYSDPPIDSDISDLDDERLRRLAGAMGVEDGLNRWIARLASDEYAYRF